MVCLKVTVKITNGHIKVAFENSLIRGHASAAGRL
jgi:hypothetical protein